MNQVVWTLPVPSTALLHGCVFQKLPRRGCALIFEYENDDGKVISLKLLFESMEAFKCTYEQACTPEMIRSAYDKLVDVNPSDWLTAIQGQLVSYGARNVDELRHLMIYLDDGPCYEFICRTFRAEESV